MEVKEVNVKFKEGLLQQYLECLDNIQSVQPDGTAVFANVKERADPGVTYFVDEEGRHFHQHAGDDQNIVALPIGNPEEPESLKALMPSEDANGEVSHVVTVQEDNKLTVKAKDQSENETSDKDGVWHFKEDEGSEKDEEGEVSEEEEEGDTEKVKKSKVAKVKKLFKCSLCNYTTPKRNLLLRHVKCHSDVRPHKCKVCERGFKTIYTLQCHLNAHNGVKPLICEHCNQPFTTLGALVRHVRYKHTHEKPHSCSECEYAFVELHKLRRHMRIHTGERPHQCEHCTYASTDSFKLKRHLRTHTGEKPYKCEHCTKRFSQRNSLNSHQLIHNPSAKPVFACDLCRTKYGRKSDLWIHKKLHMSDEPPNVNVAGRPSETDTRARFITRRIKARNASNATDARSRRPLCACSSRTH